MKKKILKNIERVVIHIGMTKTGSTALQNFLLINNKNLISEKMFFPLTGLHINMDLRPGRTAGHQSLLINNLKNGNDDVIEELNNELSNQKEINTILLSAENLFHSADEELIMNIYNTYFGCDVKIIVYLRRQDTWTESIYNEAISGGHARETRKFNRFLKNRIKEGYLNYYNILKKWRDAFGKDKIYLRVYEKSINNGGIINDYCKIIGINRNNNYAIPLPTLSNHTYLSKEKIEFLRNINKLPFEDLNIPYKLYMDKLVLYIQSKHLRQKPVWMRKKDRVKLLNKFDEMNNIISKEFYNSEKLFPSIEEYCPKYHDLNNIISLNHACKAIKLIHDMGISKEKDE